MNTVNKAAVFEMKKGSAAQNEDPVDQANLDLRFVEAFIDIISKIDGDRQLDCLRSGTVSVMCLESNIKIERLRRFINAIPINIVRESVVA